MAHHYYTPEEEVSFDQQSKRDALPISHPGRGDGQQEVGERGLPCVSPAPELDGKSRSSTRRRIQVACNRCRKRKIKCSGDIGDGQGCSNCQTSGNPNCQFLRVNSSMLQTKVGVWAYPTANGISQSHRMGLYTSSMGKSRVHTVSSQGLRGSPYSRSSSHDLGSTDPQQSYSRSPLVEHAMSYEDDSPAGYTLPSSAYMLPTDYCGLSWAKAWGPNMNMSRAPNGGMFTEHEADGSVPQSAYSYMFSGLPSADPAMTLLSETQGTDRTLPNPTTRNQQMGLATFAGVPETVPGLTHAQDYRVGQHWAAKAGVSSNVRSMQSGPSGAFSTSPINRTKPLPSNTQDMVFGFVPMTSTGTSSPMMTSCGGFAGLDAVDAGDEYRASGEAARLTRSLSRDNTSGCPLSLNEYGSDIYGYSSTERKKCSDAGDSGAAATLINGLPYTRPKHPEHPYPTDGMADIREATEVHRAPASALSNPGGF